MSLCRFRNSSSDFNASSQGWSTSIKRDPSNIRVLCASACAFRRERQVGSPQRHDESAGQHGNAGGDPQRELIGLELIVDLPEQCRSEREAKCERDHEKAEYPPEISQSECTRGDVGQRIDFCAETEAEECTRNHRV